MGLRGFSDSLKKENVDYNILDVYPTNIKMARKRKRMDINFVLEMIYNAMLENKKELVLDEGKMISKEKIEFYKENGYVIFNNILDHDIHDQYLTQIKKHK